MMFLLLALACRPDEVADALDYDQRVEVSMSRDECVEEVGTATVTWTAEARRAATLRLVGGLYGDSDLYELSYGWSELTHEDEAVDLIGSTYWDLELDRGDLVSAELRIDVDCEQYWSTRGRFIETHKYEPRFSVRWRCDAVEDCKYWFDADVQLVFITPEE